MLLYLNLPIRAGMVLVLTDNTNPYKQLQPTRHRFFPEGEGIEITDKIAKRFLKEKTRTDGDGNRVPFLIEKPYSGEWPVKLDVVPRMPKRRKRAGQLRPQGDPTTTIVQPGRRLPAQMQRKNTAAVPDFCEADFEKVKDVDVEAKVDPLVLKDDGDDRFTRLENRDDVAAGRKLKSLADKDFSEMTPGMVGMAVKTLGFKWVNPEILLKEKQAALEKMCEIVSQEVEIS